MVEIRGQRSPGYALEGSAVGLASGYTSWLFSRGRDFGPGAYLFVVLGTSTRLRTSFDSGYSMSRIESGRGRGNRNALSRSVTRMLPYVIV